MRWVCILLSSLLIAPVVGAQMSPFQMEESNTKASLRGIHAVGGGVAWASGTDGTVLRTEDAGFVWQGCAMPPGAEKLDFRGVWAWDANTAIVMSSGPGDASRLYKTSDGCVTWKLLYTNPDKDGFWDAIAFSDRDHGFLLGDPVDGKLVLMRSSDGGGHWSPVRSSGLAVPGAKIGIFAASNSSMVLDERGLPWIATGSAQSSDGKWVGPFLLAPDFDCPANIPHAKNDPCFERFRFTRQHVPLASGSEASGIFSLDIRYDHGGIRKMYAVGGDYQKPNETTGTAAWAFDGKDRWIAATTPPHGYRSAVAYDLDTAAWVAAGPNGSDFSRDDGKTWQTLDVTDVKNGWNAISLPWFAGPNGRIGKLVSLPQASPTARTGKTR